MRKPTPSVPKTSTTTKKIVRREKKMMKKRKKKRKKKRRRRRRSWEVMGSRSMGKLWVLRTLMKRILLMKILLMMRMTRLQRRSFWSITMCWEFNPMQHSRFFFRLIFLIFLTYWSTGDKEGLPSTGETTPPRQVERGECWGSV